ncbi:MAG: methyltransferase domain-containing protein [Chloroflexota bacterium]|nr:methyltransferase domain-containing protein [Chloroflexota bacterium]
METARYYDRTWWQYRTLWSPLHKHFGYYDDKARTHGRSLVRLLEVLWEAAATRPGMRILDAGCGVGGTSLWLAKQGVNAQGLTLSHREAQRATTSARRLGLSDHVSFWARDYAHTCFSPATFDQVWAVESLCQAQDRAAFVREAHRILKPGGTLVVCDWWRAPGQALTGRDAALLRRWLDCWAIPDLTTVAEFIGLLAANGFTSAIHRDTTEHILPSCRRLAGLALLTWPLVPLACRSSEERTNHRGAWLQHQALRRGLWKGDFIVARREG